MNVYMLERELFVDQPRDVVFSFFAQPENLGRITPPAMEFKILTPQPIRMKIGALIDYSVRLWGIPTHWRTLITSYDPPQRFVDEQLKGPYIFWHHTHTFVKKGNGTLIRDRVQYVMPFGLFGKVFHVLFVKKQLEFIFTYRSRMIERIFREDKPHKLFARDIST